jgi:hypothetical protein
MHAVKDTRIKARNALMSMINDMNKDVLQKYIDTLVQVIDRYKGTDVVKVDAQEIDDLEKELLSLEIQLLDNIDREKINQYMTFLYKLKDAQA